MRKNILIIHHDDNDGYMSAAILTKYEMMRGNSVYAMYANYAQPLKNIWDATLSYTVSHVDKLYLLDYSISTKENIEFIEYLIDTLKIDITWIDHHKSSIDSVIQNPKLDVDGYRVIGVSASLLCWIYTYDKNPISKQYDFTGFLDHIKQNNNTYDELDKFKINIFINCEPIPKAILLIDRYDIWANNDDSIYFHYGFLYDTIEDLIPYTEFEKCDSQVNEYIKKGKIIKHVQDLENEENVKRNSFEVDIVVYNNDKGVLYKALALNTNRFTSLTFGEKIDDYDICMPFCYNGKNNKWIVSMYTNKDNIDCSVLCKYFGGGGHKQAAGFSATDINPIIRKLLTIRL